MPSLALFHLRNPIEAGLKNHPLWCKMWQWLKKVKVQAFFTGLDLAASNLFLTPTLWPRGDIQHQCSPIIFLRAQLLASESQRLEMLLPVFPVLYYYHQDNNDGKCHLLSTHYVSVTGRGYCFVPLCVSLSHILSKRCFYVAHFIDGEMGAQRNEMTSPSPAWRIRAQIQSHCRECAFTLQSLRKQKVLLAERGLSKPRLMADSLALGKTCIVV